MLRKIYLGGSLLFGKDIFLYYLMDQSDSKD